MLNKQKETMEIILELTEREFGLVISGLLARMDECKELGKLEELKELEKLYDKL